MIWLLTNNHSSRACRTAGDEHITHFGKRIVLLAESDSGGIDGVFVASNCKFTVGGYPCASVDLFLWMGDRHVEADAIRQAIAATRHVFGNIVGNGIAARACEVNESHKQAFIEAGFRTIGLVEDGEVLGIELGAMPDPVAPLNCQLGLFEGAA